MLKNEDFNVTYDKFVELAMDEMIKLGQSKNVIEDLLSSAKTDEIRSDISAAISRIRERKINTIIDEKQ